MHLTILYGKCTCPPGLPYCVCGAETKGKIITKKRYIIPIENGLKVELDIFEGFHKGKILAEVEFPDEETAVNFQPLSWFGEDVTYQEEYHNSNMSL